MNAPTDLTNADILPYSQTKSVVRLIQSGKCYAGYTHHIVLFNDSSGTNTFGIMIGPMIRFGYFGEDTDTGDHLHHHLIKGIDRPIKGSRVELSEQFVLPLPMKSTFKQQEGILSVESNDCTVTISTRDNDINSVSQLFERESGPQIEIDDEDETG